MDTDMRDRRIGRAAWVMAWVGLVVGQFHAMARHNTTEGRSDLESSTVRVWSDPARDFFSPLLDWASADTVYMTYGKIWFPVFAAFTACAYVLYQRRRPQGFEKFAWRFALVAYVWGVLAVFVTYWTQWTPPYSSELVDMAFLFLDIPAVLLGWIGSTMLGITLIVRGYRPRVTGWLIALTFPLAMVITEFTSLGSATLPEMFAFGIAGHQLSRSLRQQQAQTTLSGSSV